MEKELKETMKNLDALTSSLEDFYKELDERVKEIEKQTRILKQGTCTHGDGTLFVPDDNNEPYCEECGFNPYKPLR